MKKQDHVFPKDIEPLTAEEPEKRSVTMKLFEEKEVNEGEKDDGKINGSGRSNRQGTSTV